MDSGKKTFSMADFKHTAELFMKVSSFARYLLDNELSFVLKNKQNGNSDIICNLNDECDTLNNSLKNFKQLFCSLSTKVEDVSIENSTSEVVIPIKERKRMSSLSIMVPIEYDARSKNVEKLFSRFKELCKLVKKKIVTSDNLAQIDGHYCFVCNMASTHVNVFNVHCTSKNHFDNLQLISEIIELYKCKICQLELIVPKTFLKPILALNEHTLLDKHIERIINEQNVKKVDKNVNKCLVNYVTEDSTIDSIILKKACQMFQTVKEMIKSKNRDLKDFLPHYCSMCDVIAYSSDDFINHTCTKEHIASVNMAFTDVNIIKCHICKFVITGYEIVLQLIINCIDHKNLDTYLQNSSQDIVEETSLLLGTSSVRPEPIIETSFRSLMTGIKNETTVIILKDFDIENFDVDPNQKIVGLPDNLKEMMRSLTHTKKISSTAVKLSLGFCFICKTKLMNTDFNSHIEGKKHLNNVNTLSNYCYIYSCPTCKLSICGTKNDIYYTLKSTEHINFDKKVNGTLSPPQNDANNSKSTLEIDESLMRQFVDSYNQISSYNKSECENSNNSSDNSPVIDDFCISQQFYYALVKIQFKTLKQWGFCISCKKSINIEQGWANHINTKKHLFKTKDINIKKRSQCRHCPFEIYGDKVIEGKFICLNIHFKLNHSHNIKNESLKNESTFNITEENN